MKNVIKRIIPVFLLVFVVFLCGFRKVHNDGIALHEGQIDNVVKTNSLDGDNISIVEEYVVEEYVVEAFNYLNAIRENPSAYSSTLGVDLSDVEPRQPLKLNQSLIKAAQAKAYSMASQDYFSHKDPEGYGMNIRIKNAGYDIPEKWYDDPSKNFFESIGAGGTIATSKDVIDLLIIDEDTPSLGHRKHLLGMDEFHSNCIDFGIGHAYNPNSLFKHYWCVLIAKHNF